MAATLSLQLMRVYTMFIAVLMLDHTGSRRVDELIRRVPHDVDRKRRDPQRPNRRENRLLLVKPRVIHLRLPLLLLHLLVRPVHGVVQFRVDVAGGLGPVHAGREHVLHHSLFVLVGVEDAGEEGGGAVSEGGADGVVGVLSVVEGRLRVPTGFRVEGRQREFRRRCGRGLLSEDAECRGGRRGERQEYCGDERKCGRPRHVDSV
mmetsp:Transcript_10698/g.23208  ORF Transcript_10698/g.23208 Transcript_10698/m.23208 type:complete len:205 (+) Transcript_10698:153-767(+)